MIQYGTLQWRYVSPFVAQVRNGAGITSGFIGNMEWTPPATPITDGHLPELYEYMRRYHRLMIDGNSTSNNTLARMQTFFNNRTLANYNNLNNHNFVAHKLRLASYDEQFYEYQERIIQGSTTAWMENRPPHVSYGGINDRGILEARRRTAIELEIVFLAVKRWHLENFLNPHSVVSHAEYNAGEINDVPDDVLDKWSMSSALIEFSDMANDLPRVSYRELSDMEWGRTAPREYGNIKVPNFRLGNFNDYYPSVNFNHHVDFARGTLRLEDNITGTSLNRYGQTEIRRGN